MNKVVPSIIGFVLLAVSCTSLKIAYTPVGLGWSQNSVNTVIFRNQALTTYKNYQFIAYYNPKGQLVLGKRKLNTEQWVLKTTPYSGNVQDAHNSISIAVDAEGYLHVSWNQHNTRLRYARGKTPLALELGEELRMTGKQEKKVTYPEFHNLPNGQLLFLYRSGESGRGNMVVNRYDPKTREWKQLHANLIDGEGQRSAYWQTCVDTKGNIHLSWVWRETWDVRTNHDIAYSVSKDNGITWESSDGEEFQLPIKASTAEYAWKVAQNSNLINQTAMSADKEGNPYIATYWNADSVTQYKIVYHNNGKWQLMDTRFRTKDFELGGGGTKSIPISRPELLINNNSLFLLFRDEARNNKITLANYDISKKEWQLTDVSKHPVGQWEPNYDRELWKNSQKLHIFSQKVSQVDGEGLDTHIPPQSVQIIEIH